MYSIKVDKDIVVAIKEVDVDIIMPHEKVLLDKKDILKNNLKYKPMIICTGAAIAYFTKDQAPINNFIDKIYLGWLLRMIFHPSAFFQGIFMHLNNFF